MTAPVAPAGSPATPSAQLRRIADVCLPRCTDPAEALALQELFDKAGAARVLEQARNAAGARERLRRRRQHKTALRERLGSGPQPPPELLCPITMERPREPVLLSDGHVYERSAIQAWLQKDARSPLTRAVIAPQPYVPWATVELAQARLYPAAALQAAARPTKDGD